MNRLTSMRMQASSEARGHAPRMQFAEALPVSTFQSSALANTVSLKSPSSDPTWRSPDRTKKTIHDVAAVAAPHSLSAEQGFMMHITIDASCVTQLRRLAMGTCGDLVAFMRIQPIAHATKMKVWLRLSELGIGLIMDAVMRSLPSAEFGRITPA